MKIFSLILVAFLIARCNSKPGARSKSIEDSVRIKQYADSFKIGKSLFANYCEQCHSSPEKHLTDQYLFDNLFDKMPSPSEDFFVKYVQDSKFLKASGDKYAIELSKLYDTPYEHRFKDSLTHEEILELMLFLKITTKSKH